MALGMALGGGPGMASRCFPATWGLLGLGVYFLTSRRAATARRGLAWLRVPLEMALSDVSGGHFHAVWDRIWEYWSSTR